MSSEVHSNMEIRKLSLSELYTLGTILSNSDCWKKLMAIVPKQGNIPKFTSEHISMIEQAAQHRKCNAAEIFLDEWSTMGKRRPTLGTLLELLVKAELFRAADYIACDILKQEAPKRPDNGPAAPVDISDIAINKLLDAQHRASNNVFDESVISGLTLDLEVKNAVYSRNKTVNERNDIIYEISSHVTDDSSSCEDLTGAMSEIVSDLMKFSVTNNEAVNRQMIEHTSSMIPIHLLSSFNKDVGENESGLEKAPEIPKQYYKELSSQELPVFLNNAEQSVIMPIEEMCSSDIPLCLKQ